MALAAVIEDCCLFIRGELDAHSAPQLHREVASAEGLIDRIDLGDLTFVDSAGADALVTVRRRYPTLQVSRPSAPLLRIVQLAGLDDAFAFADAR